MVAHVITRTRADAEMLTNTTERNTTAVSVNRSSALELLYAEALLSQDARVFPTARWSSVRVLQMSRVRYATPMRILVPWDMNCPPTENVVFVSQLFIHAKLWYSLSTQQFIYLFL